MLGSTDSINLLKTSHAVTARGKATAEWNHNIFSSPRIYGSLDGQSFSFFKEQIATGATYVNSSLRSSTVFKTNTPSEKFYSRSYNLVGLPATFNPTTLANQGFKIDTEFAQCFRVSFYAKTSSSTSDKLFIHFTEYLDNDLMQQGGMSRAFLVDNIDWTYNEVIVQVTNRETNSLHVDFSGEIAGDYQVSDLTIVKIPSYEYGHQDYRVKDVFLGFRPGDELAENNTTSKLTNVIYTSTADGYAYQMDSLSYFIKADSAGVFALYDKTIKTNKIVLKLLNGADSDSLYGNHIGTQYKIHTYDASTNEWTDYNGSSLGDINDNGSLILYWNGTTWTKTNSIATIASDGKSLENVTSIDGIAVTVNGITAANIDNNVRILELSPRLIVDLSDYITQFSTSKEIDSNDLPVPIGVATSNNAQLVLENLPRVFSESSYFNIFSDYSSKTPFNNLLKKNVKVRMKYDLINGDGVATDSDLSLFTGFVDTWEVDDQTVHLNMFDFAKYLQGKRSKDLLITDDSETTLYNIITRILQDNGVSDYVIPDTLRLINIETFFTDRQKTVWEIIQELILPYQYMAYFNNDGILIIKSSASLSASSPVFKFTDMDSDGYTSNINSLAINKKETPSEIKIRYKQIATKISPDKQDNDINTDTVAQTIAPETLWKPADGEGLGFTTIKKTIYPYDKEIWLDTTMWSTSGKQAWTDFSGYLMVDEEIMRYDGMEHVYSLDGSTWNTVVIKSQKELKKLDADLAEAVEGTGNKTLSRRRTGKLCNVERGMFDTAVRTHYAIAAELIPGAITPAQPGIESVGSGSKYFSKTKRGDAIVEEAESPAIANVQNQNGVTVIRLQSISGKEMTMFGFGGDSDAFDTYEFNFAYPADRVTVQTDSKGKFTQGNPHNENDYMGIFMGAYPDSNSGIFVEFPLKGNTKKKKTAVYLANATKPIADAGKTMMDLLKQTKASKVTIDTPKKVSKKPKKTKKTKKGKKK